MAKSAQPLQPIVNIAPLGQLSVYVVHEHEIDTLGRGSPGSMLLDLSFALLAFAAGTLVSITTGTFSSDRLFFVVFSAFLVALVAGGICLLVGIKLYQGNKAILSDIKNRMPPQGTQALPSSATFAPPANPVSAASAIVQPKKQPES
ncbi:MAG: hypothetical protein K2X38_04850 [Gemmataceae bacterium]|nr:hypothetical protein [Gemmataceae bacterium]